MRILKLVLTFLSFFLFLATALLGHAFVTVIAPARRWHVLSSLTFILINGLKVILGLRLKTVGQKHILEERGHFIISRHLSYLDGIVLGSLLPAVFVSKREICRWPVIGPVVAVSGTIFVDRTRKQKVSECIGRIREMLRRGINVFVFPEGTSSDGSQVRPFQTVFFQAAVEAGAPVVPVTITYEKLDGRAFTKENRDDICWYGGMNFFRHLWNLLRFRRIDIRVEIHEKFLTRHYENGAGSRKVLSRKCHNFITDEAGLI